MAKTNGTNVGIYIGGVKIAYATSSDVERNHSVREATSKDSGGNSESLEGLLDWKMSGEGFVDPTATYGYDELEAAFIARAPLSVRYSTETSGVSYYQGQAYLESLSQSSTVEDTVTFSFSLKGTGALAYIALT